MRIVPKKSDRLKVEDGSAGGEMHDGQSVLYTKIKLQKP
jgi:hypothetical protein